MKKLEKLNTISLLNKNEMKEVKGGYFKEIVISLWTDPCSAKIMCNGSCQDENKKIGTCKYSMLVGDCICIAPLGI